MTWPTTSDLLSDEPTSVAFRIPDGVNEAWIELQAHHLFAAACRFRQPAAGGLTVAAITVPRSDVADVQEWVIETFGDPRRPFFPDTSPLFGLDDDDEAAA